MRGEKTYSQRDMDIAETLAGIEVTINNITEDVKKIENNLAKVTWLVMSTVILAIIYTVIIR